MKSFSVDDKISPRSAALCMAICAFLWSTSGALIKYIEWNGYVINCLRSLIAGLMLLVYLRLVGRRLIVNRVTLTAAVAVCIKYSCFILGNKLTSSATMVALQYTSPVFVLLISFVFFRQKAKAKDIAVAIAAAVGIAMLTLDGAGPSSMTGNLMGLSVGITTAIMYLLTSRCKSYAESLSVIIIGHLYTAAVFMPFMFTSEIRLTGKNVMGIVMLGFLQQAVAYALYSFAIRSAPPLTCNLVGCINPLFNPVWSAILIREIPGWMTLAGFAIVLGSITMWTISNTLEKSKAENQAN